MERFTDSQTWYVIFDRSYGTWGWWNILLHKKFQHVHLVRECNDKVLMVNFFRHVMALKDYDNGIESFLVQELEQNPTAILQLTVHYGSHYKSMPIGFMSCVGMCKRVLGIRSRRIITPKQLYHELIKAGAAVIKPYCIM